MNQPVDLQAVLAGFTEAWSPRIVAYLNDYDIRLARFAGEHVWHVHNDTDEFFLVLDGTIHIGLREAGGERTVTLGRNNAFVVPKGTFHKPSSRTARWCCSSSRPAPSPSATSTTRCPTTWTPPRGIR